MTRRTKFFVVTILWILGLTLIFLVLDGPADACEYGVHLATYHTHTEYNTHVYRPPPKQDYIWQAKTKDYKLTTVQPADVVTETEQTKNGFNPGVFVTCDGPTAGTYWNSSRKPTMYAGWTVTSPVSWLPVSLTAGLASGYGKPVPLLAPSVELPGGLRLVVFPTHNHRSGGIHAAWVF